MGFNFLENKNLLFIKIVAILYISFIYGLGSILFSVLTDRYILPSLYDRTEEEMAKKSTTRHVLETTIILSIYGLIAYIGRNILQEIPFPFDGSEGFKYMQVKEVASGGLLLWMLINISPILTNKVKTLRIRFSF